MSMTPIFSTAPSSYGTAVFIFLTKDVVSLAND